MVATKSATKFTGMKVQSTAAASLVLLAGAIGTRIVPALGVLRRSSPAMCMIGAMPKSIPNRRRMHSDGMFLTMQRDPASQHEDEN
jgi:hypothetical protein